VITGLLMMKITPAAVAHHGSGLSRLRQGLGFVRTTPIVFRTIALAGLVATFGMNFSVWVPLIAKHEYGVAADGFGILLSALGLGSLGGALGLAFFGRGARPGVMMLSAATMGVALVSLAISIKFSAPMIVGLILLPIMGFAMTTTMSMANTTVQMVTPHELRGRVLSVYLTVFAGSAPFGALLMGAIASEFGIGASVAIGGAVTLLAAVVVASRSGLISQSSSRRWQLRIRARSISPR
jgi:predicted MFS family arabinose efflux permease